MINFKSSEAKSVQGNSLSEPFTIKELFLVFALLSFAILLRAYHLHDFPLMIHNDEMNCGLEARAVLHDPHRPFLLGTGWSGHPNFGYLFGGISLLISDTLWGLRLGSAVMGVFSLLFMYLFMREGFNRRIALITLFLATVFHFHIYFSRIGTHFNQAAFFIPLCLWLSLRAARDWNRWWCLAAGLSTGLAMQVYPATQVLLPVFFVWIVLQLFFLSNASSKKEFLRGALLCAVGTVVALSPMIIHYFTGGALEERSGRTFLFTKENLDHLAFDIGPLNYAKIFWYQLQAMTVKLFFKGDACIQFGYQGMLVGPLLPFVIWGIGCAVMRWKEAASQLLLLIISLTWITGGLLLVDPPAFQRLIAFGFLLPAFAALGLEWLQKLSRRWKQILLTFVLLGWAGWNANTAYYFYMHQPVWARDIAVRHLESDQSIKGFLLVTNQDENMRYESYQFMAPRVNTMRVAPPDFTAGLAQCPKPCAVAVPLISGSLPKPPPSTSDQSSIQWQHLSWPSDGGERAMYWAILP